MPLNEPLRYDLHTLEIKYFAGRDVRVLFTHGSSHDLFIESHSWIGLDSSPISHLNPKLYVVPFMCSTLQPSTVVVVRGISWGSWQKMLVKVESFESGLLLHVRYTQL